MSTSFVSMMNMIAKKIIAFIITLLARLVLRKYRPKIIAVTGSVGKTSTKDAIYHILSKRFFVRKSEKSFNSEFGVPLTILGCPSAWHNPIGWLRNIYTGILLLLFRSSYPQWLVLEVGADRPGDIARIASWIRPDIAIVTRIPDIPAHVEFFPTPESVAAEKGALLTHMKTDGTAVLYGDDPRVLSLSDRVPGAVITYGFSGIPTVRAERYSVHYDKNGIPEGIVFYVRMPDGKKKKTTVSGTLGNHIAHSALAGIAGALAAGIDIATASDSLADFLPPQGRMRILAGITNSIIIDDTYNSSPVALAEALMTLSLLKTSGRKIAVLGDMLELGEFSVREHVHVGTLVPGIADVLCVVGTRAKDIAESARHIGMPSSQIFEFSDSRLAGEWLRTRILVGDIVLVKGSQGIRMERVVEAIIKNPEQAGDLLVRQDSEWKTR